jgi:glucosamine-phosphate N-acetyltransferase
MASPPDSPPPLFPPNLIPANIQSALPEGYTLRPLAAADHGAGFLDCLRELTAVGDISEQAFRERYDWLADRGRGEYFVVVVEDRAREPGARVVGTGALVVERKL